MSTDFIKIDRKKCVKCGFCITDCPTCVLEMGEDGPQIREDQCIECGHCVSVCPTEALNNARTPRADQELIDPEKLPTPEEAACFLRTRRSIRGFEKAAAGPLFRPPGPWGGNRPGPAKNPAYTACG